MRNSKVGNIIESLRVNEELKEAINGIVPPNDDNSEPSGLKKGDYIKVTKNFTNNMYKGTVWVLVYPSKDGIQNNVYGRVLQNGKISKVNSSNMEGLSIRTVQQCIANGTLIVLKQGSLITEGEIDISVIKDVVKLLDYDKAIGKPINQIVTTSGPYFRIAVRDKTEHTIDIKYIIRLIQNLKAKGFDMSVAEKSIDTERGTYSGYSIVIDKNPA